ncbi:MAG: 3-deoxy-manno-octulosonate cytidylyltransferase, partial [Desulfatibacillaceae bacterium]|nr:3-deoxy-manno-octulosonate cytidylyltransferase [Desulfatibacillaceae bacterium]
MKTAVIIPARYGSTRFCAKPLAAIHGRPMIWHVYQRAAKAPGISEVAVATDDERIAEAVKAFGGRAVLTSRECRSGTDRVAQAGRELGLFGDDIVVNVQGDQPLLAPENVTACAAPLQQNPETGMSTLAFAIVEPGEITNPKDVKVVFDNKGFALYFSRSPIPFARDGGKDFPTYKHLGIYAYTMNFLETYASLEQGRLEDIEKLEQLRVLENGLKIKVVVTPFDSLEVD